MIHNTTLIKNARLLDPLQAELLDRHDLLIEGDTIREVSDRPLAAGHARVIDAGGRTVMPGLIDLHVHVIAVELNLALQAHLPNVLVTLRSVPILRGMLRRGFTTVRDAGGAGAPFKQAMEAGLIQGPRLFVSGRALSQTGGHGDARARSDYLTAASLCPNCARVGEIARVADTGLRRRRALDRPRSVRRLRQLRRLRPRSVPRLRARRARRVYPRHSCRHPRDGAWIQDRLSARSRPAK